MTRLPVRTGGVGHVLFLKPLGGGVGSGRGADAPFFFCPAATIPGTPACPSLLEISNQTTGQLNGTT